MKRYPRLHQLAVAAYAVTIVLFIGFFILLSMTDGVSRTSARPSQTFYTVESFSAQEVEDPLAPQGLHNVFRWTLTLPNANENCLGFYTVHQYVEVLCDGESIYRLEPHKDNLITRDVGSNWVNIPLYPSDAGKEITVILTPVYSSSIETPVEFLVGSRYAIFADCLKKDLPQLALSLFCVLIGMYVGPVQLYLLLRKHNRSFGQFFLSHFLVILGVWRLADLPCVPMMLPNHTLLAGYVTIGALFVCCLPMLLFLHDQTDEYWSTPLLGMMLLICAVALSVLVLQLTHTADFRDVLIFSHIMFIPSIILALLSVFNSRHRRKTASNLLIVIYIVLLFTSVLVDLGGFYLTGSSLGLMTTICTFAISTVALLTYYILDNSVKVYIDAQTGLFNKLRWDEVMDPRTPLSEPYGLMMLDFNNLKATNDTLGHETGDAIILRFARILRESLPGRCTICRWGGDEFTVMFPRTSLAEMERCAQIIRTAVDACNATHALPPISYAEGFVLSSDFPGLSPSDLMTIADDRMYADKRLWYTRQSQLTV